MTYRAGQTVELFTPAHPYWDNRVNLMDRCHTIPAVTERLRITRVTPRPNGDVRLTLRRPDSTGFAIVVQDWLASRKAGTEMRNRYYVETYRVRGRHVGYRVFDGSPAGPAERQLVGHFTAKVHGGGDMNVALHLANTLRDDLNGGIR